MLFVLLTQICQGRGRLGKEESGVAIEGYEEEEDGKLKTPAPVSMLTESLYIIQLYDRNPSHIGQAKS